MLKFSTIFVWALVLLYLFVSFDSRILSLVHFKIGLTPDHPIENYLYQGNEKGDFFLAIQVRYLP